MIERASEALIRAALDDTPVVLLNGARQTGKTTLVKAIAAGMKRATYATLDDAVVLSSALHDPRAFIESLAGTAIIDEVQKAPGLFPAIKLSVDDDRRPGRFLLTGSANVMVVPKMSESLAGRMEIVTLRTLSQSEIDGTHGRFVDRLFDGNLPGPVPRLARASLVSRIHRGGFPEALQRPEARRSNWFASYLTTILQRDVRDLSNIAALAEGPRLLALLADRSAGLLNVADVSRDSGIPHSTLQRYLALFEALFIVYRIPAWSANVGKRLVKASKLLFCDTGLMAFLLNASEKNTLEDARRAGRFLETFVGCELLKQIEWSQHRPLMLHYRTGIGAEVDFVLEAGGRELVGVGVKLTSTPGSADFRGLRSLSDDAGSRFKAGVLLHTGHQVVPFGAKMWAVPVNSLWGGRGGPS